MIKKFSYFLLGMIIMVASTVFAAPYFNYYRTLLPIDSTENVGTTTAPFDEGHFNEICLNGDCQTAWSAGGGEANTASSLGSGLNLFDSKSGVDLRFNTISAGSNITLSTTSNSNTIVISSTASGGGDFPFTVNAGYNSTSTVIGFLNGLFSTASSTFSSTFRLPALSNGGLAVFSGLVSSGATTTAGTGLTYSGNAFNVNTTQNIAKLSNLTSNGFVKTSGSDGTLSVDTTTYESGLTAGDGLTRTVNDFDCDIASGTVFGCLSTTDWTTFNNKQDTITAGDALTLTGTDIDFDGGASPGGSLGGTWASPTIDDLFILNTGDVGTGSYTFPYASSTAFSTAYASSTLYYGAGLTACDATTGKIIWANGQFGCGTDFNTGSGGSGTISTSTIPTIGQLAYWTSASYPSLLGSVATTSVTCTGSVTCSGFNVLGSSPITINGTGGSSGDPAWATTSPYTGALVLYPADQTNEDVVFGSNTGSTTTAPFWWDVSATSTYIGNGGIGTSSMSFSGSSGTNKWWNVGSYTNGTGNGNFFIASSSNSSDFTNKYFEITEAGVVTQSNATTTLFTATTAWVTNLFIGAVDIAEYIADTVGAMFTGNTETGITVTYQDADNTIDVVCDTASGSTFGCLTSTDWNTFNGKQATIGVTFPITLSGATIGFGGLSTSSSPTIGHLPYFSGVNTFASVATSTPTVTAPITYSGTLGSFVGGISGTFGCAIANTSTTGCLTDTDWDTFNNKVSYTDAAVNSYIHASTTIPKLYTSNTWSNTNLFTSILGLPTATSPTLGGAGYLALDTTSNNLIMATSTNGHIVVASATTTLYSFTASTTAITSGTIIDMASHPLEQVATKMWCKVSGGTSIQIFISDGTNDTNTITCTTTGTEYALTSNNTFTAYEAIRAEFGTKTGDTGYLSVRIMGYRISN